MERIKKGIDVTLSYSDESELLMKAIKNFDIDKFEEEFLKNISIGSRTILEYIFKKQKEVNKNV